MATLLLDGRVRLLSIAVLFTLVVAGVLTFIELRIRAKRIKVENKREDSLLLSLKKQLSSDKDPMTKLNILDRSVKGYFKENYGTNLNSDYSFLINEFGRTKRNDLALFCKKVFDAYYSLGGVSDSTVDNLFREFSYIFRKKLRDEEISRVPGSLERANRKFSNIVNYFVGNLRKLKKNYAKKKSRITRRLTFMKIKKEMRRDRISKIKLENKRRSDEIRRKKEIILARKKKTAEENSVKKREEIRNKIAEEEKRKKNILKRKIEEKLRRRKLKEESKVKKIVLKKEAKRRKIEAKLLKKKEILEKKREKILEKRRRIRKRELELFEEKRVKEEKAKKKLAFKIAERKKRLLERNLILKLKEDRREKKLLEKKRKKEKMLEENIARKKKRQEDKLFMLKRKEEEKKLILQKRKALENEEVALKTEEKIKRDVEVGIDRANVILENKRNLTMKILGGVTSKRADGYLKKSKNLEKEGLGILGGLLDESKKIKKRKILFFGKKKHASLEEEREAWIREINSLKKEIAREDVIGSREWLKSRVRP